MSRIRLRLIRSQSLVLWSMVSQNLRPHGAARTLCVYFTLCQQSPFKSQNSGYLLNWRFWPNWRSEKIQAGNSQKLGYTYIRGVSYIRDKTVHIFNKLGKALMSRWNGYQNKLIFIQQKEFENVICEMVAILLTHCGLMMPYGNTDLGQRWLG